MKVDNAIILAAGTASRFAPPVLRNPQRLGRSKYRWSQ